MKRRCAADWVENDIMGEVVPPELDYLVNRLKRINPAADARLIVEHARKIHTAYQLLRGRPDQHGFKIRGKIRRRAEPVPATRGLKDDLQRLLKAVRSGSAKEWQTAWLGVSGEARALVSPLKAPGSEKGDPPPVAGRNEQAVISGKSGTFAFRRSPLDTREMKLVRAASFSSVIPSAKDSIPRIEAALAKDEFSSKREADKLTYIFVLRVRDAYRALTGKKGITYRELNDAETFKPKGGFADGGLIALAKDIDRQFATNVLTVARLKKKKRKWGSPLRSLNSSEKLKLAQGGAGAALKMLHHIRTVSVHPSLEEVLADADFISASARLQAAFDVLRTIARNGERALVFIEHRRMQYRFIELAKAEFGLGRIDLINGDTPIKKRQEIVNRFQQQRNSQGFDLLVLGPKAAGTGLTLTAATHVIHLSRWWNPAVEEQCNDRVHRIGQTNPVTVHIPMAVHPAHREHSFDCLLHSLMQRKRKMAESALWPMGDTDGDAAELQRMVVEGTASTATSDEPVKGAMAAMFARDGVAMPSWGADGSLKL
jgi:Helicase conserved C-terminal domain